MKEERLKVLQMLADQKITAEEAERLLDALERGEQEEAPSAGPGKVGSILRRLFGGQDIPFPPFHRKEAEGDEVSVAGDGFALPGGARVKVSVQGGDLEVDRADEGERATFESDQRVSVRQKDDEFFIEAESGDLALHLPPVAALTVSVYGGDVELSGLSGDLDVRTFGGDLEAKDCAGNLAIDHTGGDVELRGRIESIRLEAKGGDVGLHDLYLSEGEHSVKGMGGDLELSFAPEASVTLSVHSFGGDVECDLPERERRDGLVEVQRSYTIGDGAAQLRVRNMGGDVVVHGPVAQAAD